MGNYINGWLDGVVNRGFNTGNVVLMGLIVIVGVLVFLLIIRPYKS